MSRRTSGDGMDSTSLILNESCVLKDLKLQPPVSKISLQTIRPIEPRKPVVYEVPKYVPKKCKSQNMFLKKPKEPKFVPYEPYKASVEPIIPNKPAIIDKRSKNNVAIQDLVTQMSMIRTTELNKIKNEDVKEELITKSEWEKMKVQYETDIKNLRESNSHLENQLKFQAQVNSELKTLLVAAVGEDLESRVQHLTEDKLQLARALLKSANHLTSRQEQTEWLSGQCEVWRSKFLASSLMVEELARWKSALSNRINENQDVIKGLLEERSKVKKCLCQTYELLAKTLATLQVPEVNGDFNLTCDVIELAKNVLKLSEIITEKHNCGLLTNCERKSLRSSYYETLAEKILENPVVPVTKADFICSALMDAALSTSRGQMYLQYPSTHATCCSHCKGEMQNI